MTKPTEKDDEKIELNDVVLRKTARHLLMKKGFKGFELEQVNRRVRDNLHWCWNRIRLTVRYDGRITNRNQEMYKIELCIRQRKSRDTKKKIAAGMLPKKPSVFATLIVKKSLLLTPDATGECCRFCASRFRKRQINM
jgi:hypothetical protein